MSKYTSQGGDEQTAREPFCIIEKCVLSAVNLSPAAKLVYMAIRDRITMGDNDNTWAGFRRIAKDTGLTVPTVQRAIACLEESGLVPVERKAGPKGANRYYVTLDEAYLTCDRAKNVHGDRARNVYGQADAANSDRARSEGATVQDLKASPCKDRSHNDTKCETHKEENTLSIAGVEELWRSLSKKFIKPQMRTNDLAVAFEEYLWHRNDLGEPLKEGELAYLAMTLESLGRVNAIRALGQSVERSFKGVYPPNDDPYFNPERETTKRRTSA